MPFKEADLITSIRAAIKRNYPKAYVRKLADKHSRGLPDIMIIVPLRPEFVASSATLLVETKVVKGRTSAIQDAEHFLIEKAGGLVIVARSVEQVLDKLEDLGAQP